MTGKLDPSPIPLWAVTLWATSHDIVVAVPMKGGGPPYLTKFPLHEAGLSQALRLLHRMRPAESPRPTLDNPLNLTGQVPANQPMVKKPAHRAKLEAETTEAQREHAKAFLANLLGKKPQ